MIDRLATVLPKPFRAARLAVADGPGAAAVPAAGTPTREAGRAGLANIQILRGLAASLVLVYHVAGYARAERGAAYMGAQFDMLGVWGVAVFFAISGFLMAGLVQRDPPWTFLAHRVLRIFPTYLAVVGLSVLLYTASGIAPWGLSLMSLSLAPVGPRSYPINVEWTLVFESFFYVGLFLLACAGLARRIVLLALAWLALLAVAFLVLPPGLHEPYQPPAYLLPFTAACVPFAGGLLLPRIIASGRLRPGIGFLALPLAVACLFVEVDVMRWLGGIAAVLIVGAAATAPQVAGEGRPARALLALGDGSYVLYLVHVPVLMITARLLPAEWSPLSYGLVGVALSLAVTAGLGPLDVALYRTLRRRVDRAAPARVRQGLAAYLLLFFGCAAWGSTVTAGHDWREWSARSALAALPPEAWAGRDRAEAAIAERGLALPASVRGAMETITLAPTVGLVDGWAYDPATPERWMLLALFCEGRLAGVDRPRRVRTDLAGRPGLEGLGRRRIGYRMQIPLEACPAGAVPFGVALDGDGRMAVLPGTGGR